MLTLLTQYFLFIHCIRLKIAEKKISKILKLCWLDDRHFFPNGQADEQPNEQIHQHWHQISKWNRWKCRCSSAVLYTIFNARYRYSPKCEMNDDDDDEKGDNSDERCTNVNVLCIVRTVVCDFVIGKKRNKFALTNTQHTEIYCMYCVFWNPSLCLLWTIVCFYATNLLITHNSNKKYTASLEMRSVCMHVVCVCECVCICTYA